MIYTVACPTGQTHESRCKFYVNVRDNEFEFVCVTHERTAATWDVDKENYVSQPIPAVDRTLVIPTIGRTQ